jgi:sialic acid synthase SpsE
MGSNPISSIPTPYPDRCFIIAEAGTSHGGDLEHAFALIDAAARSGADCVKFQAVYADEILHPLTGFVELPTGRIPLYERFRELECDTGFYRRLAEHAAARGIVFLCTPFGLRSAAMLEELHVSAYKIASPELNHLPLIRAVAATGKPVFLSSGVSTLGDIERALEIVGERSILMHCLTAYPAPEEEYNLRLIPNLAALLGVPVGLSDHSMDPVLVPAVAAALGARCLEKHLTLSRETSGLDDPIAVEPASFHAMVEAVRRAEADGKEEGLRRLAGVHGEARIRAVLGDGVKRLAPAERANYGRTNRSIHALTAIRRGETYGPHNTAILRTEKLLRPGLGPDVYEMLQGRRAARDVPAGEGVTWEDL